VRDAAEARPVVPDRRTGTGISGHPHSARRSQLRAPTRARCARLNMVEVQRDRGPQLTSPLPLVTRP
jgi:hypothetical protein